MFKKDKASNYLYDETGKVNLPVDGKGILILDPESRTRMIDSHVEQYIFSQYQEWVDSAIDEAEGLRAKQSVDWLEELGSAVMEDYETVNKEEDIVVDEERKKRGLTDRETHMHWWDFKGQRLADGSDMVDEQDDVNGEDSDAQSESQYPSGAASEDESHVEDEAVSDNPDSGLQDDELLPETPSQALPLAASMTGVLTTGDPTPSPPPPPLDLFAFWG